MTAIFSEKFCISEIFHSQKGKTITRSGVSSFKTALVDWPVSLKSSSVSDGIVSWDIVLDSMNPENNVFIGLACLGTTQSDLNALFQSYLGETKTCSSFGFYSTSGNFTITQAMPLLTLNPLAMVRRFQGDIRIVYLDFTKTPYLML